MGVCRSSWYGMCYGHALGVCKKRLFNLGIQLQEFVRVVTEISSRDDHGLHWHSTSTSTGMSARAREMVGYR